MCRLPIQFLHALKPDFDELRLVLRSTQNCLNNVNNANRRLGGILQLPIAEPEANAEVDAELQEPQPEPQDDPAPRIENDLRRQRRIERRRELRQLLYDLVARYARRIN